MMNKKGQLAFYSLMLGLLIIILALALAPSVSYFTNSARNATSGDTLGLDCDNESISNFNKAACIATDVNLFYFVGSLILIGGGIITARIIFN
ncbi:MAG: hypothetical protein ACLFPS_05835 [Clostridia bacterium]